MVLSLSNLQVSGGSKRTSKRLGRGNASGKGTTAGRGTKGQRARSGGRGGLNLKGLKFIVQRLPKNKGFKSLQAKFECVNLGQLDKYYQNNQAVTPANLLKLNLIKTSRHGVKILGEGALNKKLTVKAHAFSAKAKENIEKAGGQIVILKPEVVEVKK